MKKYLPKILIAVLILTIFGGVVFVPQVARAVGEGLITSIAVSGINSAIAGLANLFLGFTAWLLTVCGIFLSVSIYFTTHIKDIYTNITSINTVWIVVRDLSSIFIIFALLYYSIVTILSGQSKSGLNQLIIRVFLAGMLINFSLFFVKILVDGSNLISLQFYNAITPESMQGATVTSAFNDGGLSNIFMNSLKIPQIYQNKGVLKSVDVAASISFATMGGIIMMVVAGLSFLAAAIAFTVRTAIILFVMALSPLYFAGMIFPKIKEKVSTPLMDMLTSQLIFMPVYLFLLYIALKLISDENFTKIFNPTLTGGATSDALGAVSIGVILQYLIALIFINAPLVMAISYGGKGMKWVPGSSGVNAVNEWVGRKVGGFARRNTYGVIASKVADSNVMRTAASKNFIAAGALRGIRGIAGEYNENAKKISEEKSTFGESLGYNKRNVNKIDNDINALKYDIDDLNLVINSPNASPQDIKDAKTRKGVIEKRIREKENEIAEEKRSRQIGYASRLDPRDIDPATGKLKPTSLWQRVKKGGRAPDKKEMLASAQIHIKNTESDIEQLKKSLDDKKKEQDILKGDIKRIDEQERQGRFNSVIDLNHPQAKKRDDLKKDLYELLNGHPTTGAPGLIEIQKDIRDKELEVKRYKNIT